METNIHNAAEAVKLMNIYLHDIGFVTNGLLDEKMLWENTFIKHQIDKRNRNEHFTISDHIRGMVYSMLSSGIAWSKLKNGIDIETGEIVTIDEIFHGYDHEHILCQSPTVLKNKIQKLKYASPYTRRQMEALININIPKLIEIQRKYRNIDSYYQTFIEKDPTVQLLIKTLSDSKSKDKMVQLGVALTAEYLRNVGYDIAKPDRHTRRVVGADILTCSSNKIAGTSETMDIISQIAKELKIGVAETDYIMWAYCAKEYGEICTAKKPNCNKCVTKKYCKTVKE